MKLEQLRTDQMKYNLSVVDWIFYCLGSYFQQSINTLAHKPLCRLLLRQCLNTGWLYLRDCFLTYQYRFKN